MVNETQAAAMVRRDDAHARVVHLRHQLDEADAELRLAESRLRIAAHQDPRAWSASRKSASEQ